MANAKGQSALDCKCVCVYDCAQHFSIAFVPKTRLRANTLFVYYSFVLQQLISCLLQELQVQQQQRQASETVVKKAPWSTVANQNMQATSKDGLTLAEIQRLEREKKLEQMKEQQQMMQIIAQQQAAALAREQVGIQLLLGDSALYRRCSIPFRWDILTTRFVCV